LSFRPSGLRALNLDRLTRAAVERLERESGVSGLRWIAAEHRNTAHPHVHLVVAGVRETSPGAYRGFMLTPRRLAAMKEELALEISRQRGASRADLELGRAKSWSPAPARPRSTGRVLSLGVQQRRRFHGPAPAPRLHLGGGVPTVFARLESAARRYRRKIQREADEERRRRAVELERG